MTREERQSALHKVIQDRIIVLDSAMGTMIQDHHLSEADYRGERFKDHECDVRGNNDLLNLTYPEIISEIHRANLDAGADIIETNTFNSTSISQADYQMDRLARELNLEGAKLARAACDAVSIQTSDKPRFVAGALGPTNKTASISPDVNDPGFRNVTFDDLRNAYKEAAEGLIAGGVDLLFVETIFDTLNAKAALFALEDLFSQTRNRVPVVVSGTITDKSGRTLSGQTPEAFWNSVRHATPFAIGLNCALGAEQLRPYISDLARVANTYISAYPNAGLPNEFGEYEQSPEDMAKHVREWAQNGLLNLVGGCCGSTPAHISAIAKAIAEVKPRALPNIPVRLRLSGLEPFDLAP